MGRRPPRSKLRFADRIEEVRGMVGKHTHLITCLASWNNQNATTVVPEALKADVGLYGFSFPRSGNGTIPLNKFMAKPVSELRSDERNIAVLARPYHGLGIDAAWTEEGGFKK